MVYQVYLDLSAQALSRYYGGHASVVRVQALGGTWVQFPAAVLRAHVERDGLRGWFQIETDAEHRLKSFRPLAAGS
ncbi:MAG: DUF2835 family protein [Pseudomonadota bacterium]